MASRVGKSLVALGLFPRDLPEIFSSKQLGDNYTSLIKSFTEQELRTWTAFEPFSAPRSKTGRRIFAIVNPVSYMALAAVISANWKSIVSIHKRSKISFSRPIFNSSTRAIGDSNFIGFRDCKILRSAGYAFVLHADFSRFFPTIYTHAIEWAIHTKAVSKAALRSRSSRTLFGNKLDECVRNMQEGQTQGIPVGPDASYIIAELIASVIDESIQKKFGGQLSGGRLIDDYVLFFESRSDAEKARSALTNACRDLQVELNPEKTYISELKDESADRTKARIAGPSCSLTTTKPEV